VPLLDAATGQERFTLKGHRHWAHDLLFSPDGRRLVSAGSFRGVSGKEVEVWDASSGRELLALQADGSLAGSLAFSRDGHRLYYVNSPSSAEDVEVRVWDATPLPDGEQ
jgi:WD40 repeat protein